MKTDKQKQMKNQITQIKQKITKQSKGPFLLPLRTQGRNRDQRERNKTNFVRQMPQNLNICMISLLKGHTALSKTPMSILCPSPRLQGTSWKQELKECKSQRTERNVENVIFLTGHAVTLMNSAAVVTCSRSSRSQLLAQIRKRLMGPTPSY